MGNGSTNRGRLEDDRLSIVPRKTWGARKHFYRDPLSTPVSLVMFLATHRIKFPWWDSEKAYKILRDLQLFHMFQKFMPDIQYNFMIDDNGVIYEGRGWNTKPSMSPATRKPKTNAIYIGYVGIIDDDGPSDEMMKAGNDLISFGMRHEYIRSHHHIDGLIMGIVGTTREECISRTNKPTKSEPDEKTVKATPQDMFVF